MCFIFDAGNFFSCVCNINHPEANCTNNSCMTEIECARHIEKNLTNNVMIKDDKFCIFHVPDASTCEVFLSNEAYISVFYCCRGTDDCNNNDTAIDEVISTKLNSECLHIISLYVYVCSRV